MVSRWPGGRPPTSSPPSPRWRCPPGLEARAVRLAAGGILTAPALFAAARKPRIDVLYLSAGLVSFRAIVDSEQFPGGGHVQPRGAADPFGSLLPGSLKHTGLPEIAASLAPRRLRLTGALDAAGFPLDPADLRAAYPAANAELKPAARRDAAALLDFLEM